MPGKDVMFSTFRTYKVAKHILCNDVLYYLYRGLHGGHGLVDGGEGRDGRHENIVTDQHVALDQSVCQRGGRDCDVGGYLMYK